MPSLSLKWSLIYGLVFGIFLVSWDATQVSSPVPTRFPDLRSVGFTLAAYSIYLLTRLGNKK